MSEVKRPIIHTTVRRPLDYHKAADFIEAVRQLGIEHGYVLGRDVEYLDEPNGIPRLRFEVAQIGSIPGTTP